MLKRMEWDLVTILAILSGIVFIILIIRFSTADRYPYVHRPIMSRAELKFYHAFKDLIPRLLAISIKPRLGDIIDVDKLIRQQDHGWNGKYCEPVWSKHIDFVIFDSQTADIIFCIELDDKSHLKKENAARDRFKNKALSAAEIPLVRIQCRKSYDTAYLKKQFEPYL